MPLVGEIVALGLLTVADTVITLRTPAPDHGLITTAFSGITPALGTAAGVLAVLRRRFGRVALLTVVIAGASLLVSGLTALAAAFGTPVQAQPALTEALALALLCGAACHRLPARTIVPLVVLAGLAMTAAPLLRFGIGSPWALLAVPQALLWGAGVGTGLVLRDSAGRYAANLAAAREAERVALARELHDFVAHHITGIVVLAQGARVVAGRRRGGGEGDGPGSAETVYQQIEQAGGEALTAMRRVVGMLRTDRSSEPATAGDGRLTAELKDACGNDPRVRLTITDELAGERVPGPVVTAAHRIVLEAVTNARRYAVPGTPIEVGARLERRGLTSALLLEVVNEVEPPAVRGEGYGLLGMAERARALGGTLVSGPDAGPAGPWRVTARLPVDAGPGQPIGPDRTAARP
ncbi:histidine kinase [Kribbella flavida DSM 17836]|uniref:histidine kinase n=2 Tax=Kribbella flavida TaxID=182640 RepID=D2Q4A0_KRIFD|nr:histidine kinase [Kribbella flavida DSM 17836]